MPMRAQMQQQQNLFSNNAYRPSPVQQQQMMQQAAFRQINAQPISRMRGYNNRNAIEMEQDDEDMASYGYEEAKMERAYD